MSVEPECVACHEPTEDSLLGQPKHLNREGCVAALRARVERLEALVEAGLDAAEATEKMLRARVEQLEGAARKIGACSSMTWAAGDFFYVVPQADMLALCSALLPSTPAAPSTRRKRSG